MRAVACFAACAAAVLTSGCTGGEPERPPFRAVADLDQLMDYVVTPAALTYWGSVSVIVDQHGITEHFPATDEEWEEVLGAAMLLAETGNLMMMPPRAVSDPEWMELSIAMVEAGMVAAEAAQARDVERVFEAGEVLYNACDGCHERYLIDRSALTFPPPD